MEYLKKEEKERAKNIIFTIYDFLHAVDFEINGTEKPYKGYLLEKLKPIQNDINCLISMCQKED